MSYRILTIDPGSTSTKIGVFDDEKMLFEENLHHSAEELAQFETIPQQEAFRRRLVLKALEEHHIPLESLSAVCGRGGVLKPVHGGTYLTTDAMIDTLKKGPYGHHASNLGGLLAREIGSALHIPSYIVDPPVVDELAPLARYSGHPLITRRSIFHALNQKAVAKRYAKEIGKPYESLNLIVCHMGGGVSVGAHVKGEVVDTGNALEGEGPFSPERSGTLPSGALVDLCFSGKYTQQEIRRMITGNGGLLAYTGSTDMQELMRRAATDARVREVIDAFHYRVAKEIGAMAAAMKGQVDQIILTGGIAHGQETVDALKGYVSWIAPVTVYPGEGELLALTASDFNFERQTLTINKSLQNIKGNIIITPPKTPKSNRTIKIPQFLVDEMQDYIKSLYGLEPDDRIFPISKAYLHHEMNRGAKAAGVKRIRIHDLRHSHVSLLIEMGFSAVAIAERVGHESIDITYRYAHLFPTKQTEMANRLNSEWTKEEDKPCPEK